MNSILKSPYVFSALATGGAFFAVLNMQFSDSSAPLLNSLDGFVLFAQEEVKLDKEVQVSSGDVGSNKKAKIDKDVIVNGNLFADKVEIDKNTQINGNVSYNKLKTKKDAQIIGTQTTPVSLPIANIPATPNFQPGTQDFKFKGQNNTLPAGRYRNITLEKDSKLTLTGGTYNISELELKKGSTLIYSAPTTLNVKSGLNSQENVSILTGRNLKPDDLVINYAGKKDKKNKKDKKDDDDKEDDNRDDEEKDEDDENDEDDDNDKNSKSIKLGKNSFLNFKLLAPKTTVDIGENTTLRGQVIAKKVKIGKGTVVSREETTIKIAKPEDIVTDPDGGVYPINIILVSLTPGANFTDALMVADEVSGRIVGFVASINLYQIEVPAQTIEELDSIINTVRLRTDMGVDGVFRDYLLPTEI